jgi:hypothetical protein
MHEASSGKWSGSFASKQPGSACSLLVQNSFILNFFSAAVDLQTIIIWEMMINCSQKRPIRREIQLEDISDSNITIIPSTTVKYKNEKSKYVVGSSDNTEDHIVPHTPEILQVGTEVVNTFKEHGTSLRTCLYCRC